ncbi:hypothetical protein HYW87_03650, partial [Candidatus Roizmanbacteria bacterium]|nr:hypothetical protein [Candidatus Roizmanbacteria bacterium]
MHCFLCRKNKFKSMYLLGTKIIQRCENDGLFLAHAISRPKLYGKDYFESNPHPAQMNERYFLEKLRTIKSLTKKSKPRILDVGCGWGEFEEVLEKENVPYLG